MHDNKYVCISRDELERRMQAVEMERGKVALDMTLAGKEAWDNGSSSAFARYDVLNAQHHAWVWAQEALVFQFNALFPVRDYPRVPSEEECAGEAYRARAMENFIDHTQEKKVGA